MGIDMKKVFFSLIVFCVTTAQAATLNVVTTTSTLRSLVESVGGTRVKVDSIAQGPQDPHFIEGKPSYMVKVRQADLVVSVGLELEVGYLPSILRGARNPKVEPGQAGYLEASTFIKPLEVPTGAVDRSQGDVHASGNPHYLIDPLRALAVATGISERLTQLDVAGKETYAQNLRTFSGQITAKKKEWDKRVAATKIKELISYHRSLTYFLESFGLQLAGVIEPKPGIPPSTKHVVELIESIKARHTPCILVESFHDVQAAERIKKDAPIGVQVIPTEVNATEGAGSYMAMMESIVSALEKCHP